MFHSDFFVLFTTIVSAILCIVLWGILTRNNVSRCARVIAGTELALGLIWGSVILATHMYHMTLAKFRTVPMIIVEGILSLVTIIGIALIFAGIKWLWGRLSMYLQSKKLLKKAKWEKRWR